MSERMEWFLGRTEKQRAAKAQARENLRAVFRPTELSKARDDLKSRRIRRVGLYLTPILGWAFLPHNRRGIERAKTRVEVAEARENVEAGA